MAVIMKGAEVVRAMKEKLLTEAAGLKQQGIIPGLGMIRLGVRPDDLAYEKGAIKKAESVGINCQVFEYPETMAQTELVTEIGQINADQSIHGIMLFRPLPAQIDENVIKQVISPEKDVDCLNPVNVAKVFSGDESGFAPCTPAAVMEILEHYQISVTGKSVVVIGRSLVVGKPLAMMLLKKNATVTICHTQTANLPAVCQAADILIAAAGKAKMVTAGFIPQGGVVIDVGININREVKLCGDVDYEDAVNLAAYITPVPGGVGAVTAFVLAKNVIRGAKIAKKNLL
jgi:methylenetetrahydrofolate dehydrogenase (NADP+)/methenyltetrahydrofolate cyclohydrolase